jgi:hypothetical protein
MSVNKKRKQISLEVKYEAIKKIERKEKNQMEISKELECSKCTVSSWMKDKDTIISNYENNIELKRKRIRTSKYEDIEEALFAWLKEKRALNIPINGPILMRKAEDFSVLLGYNLDEFKISGGWLDRFKIRHNISFNVMCGESAKVSNESIDEWK